jgi:site-specific DNA-methyltransferase (adenine-specific)
MTIELIEGDCREVLREFADNSIDSVVTDPPYALTTGKKGGSGPKSVNLESPYGRARITTGFMGKAWDNGDTAFDPAFWADVLRVLKPGGHVLSFGGTRTYHRMACAIEDAGFEIRDQIGWLYGSGFPKSSNQDGEWEGWGTALKPAWEPIVVARKPLAGTVAGNLAEWGVGALNIDGCRVDAPEGKTSGGRGGSKGVIGWQPSSGFDINDGKGRWPANVIHDGSDEVLDAFPNAPGQMASTSSSRKTQNVYGEMRRGNGRENEPSADSDNDGAVGFKMKPGARRLDSGSAARFFYCAKASKKDRGEGNVHPTVKPTDLMRYLVRLVTPPNGTVLDPFMGSGSTGRGAVLEGFNFIGIEMSTEYMDIADARIAAAEAQAAPVMQAAE